MSGAWGGWLRRLRRGLDAPEAQSEAAPPAADLPAGPAVHEYGLAEQSAPFVDAVEDHPPVETQAARSAPAEANSVPMLAAPEAARSPRNLLRRGLVAQAHALAQTEADAPELAALIDAIVAGEAVLAACRLAGTGAVEDTLRGIMLAPAARDDRLLLVFGDEQGRFACPQALDAEPRPHLLFVQDKLQCLFLLGVPRLGNSYDDCLLAILRLARHLGATRVFCLGAGQSIYAALRFGLDIGAERVLGLGTLPALSPGRDLPGRRSARNLDRLLAVAGALGHDLAAAYRRASEPPALLLYRPKAAPEQAGERGAMAELAALPNATVHEGPPAAQKNPSGWVDSGGRLPNLLKSLLSGEPARPVQRRKRG